MKSRGHHLSLVAVFMATVMFLTSVPYQTALGALVPTEAAVEGRSSQQARELIHSLLAREEVQTQLKYHGIDPREAQARVDSLSDAEVTELADHFDQLPAGGSAVGIIVFATLLVFFVLLLTDLLGYTNVFPFVKKHI